MIIYCTTNGFIGSIERGRGAAAAAAAEAACWCVRRLTYSTLVVSSHGGCSDGAVMAVRCSRSDVVQAAEGGQLT